MKRFLLTTALLIAAVTGMTGAVYTDFFTDVMVAGGSKEDRWHEGWQSYDQDLNKGAGGDYIYLLYKKATTATPASGFITDFKIVDNANPPEQFTEDGIVWQLCPYTGGAHFKSMKGDLNSNAGGASLHLYYTRTDFDDKRVVTGVSFNSTRTGSVSETDLNKGAGGSDIFMHVNYSNQGQGLFDTPQDAFSINSNGRNCMHVKLLTSDFDPVRTLHGATYSLKDANGKLTPIFYVGERNSSATDDYVSDTLQSLITDESVLFLTNGTKYPSKYQLVTSNKTEYRVYRADGKGRASGNGYVEMDWYYPASVAGKTYTLHVEGSMFYEGGHLEPYKRDIGSITFDDISFQTYDAVPGTSDGEENTVKITCAGDHVIKWLQATYTNSAGKETKLDKVSLPENSYTGFLPLPAADSHTKVVVTAGIIAASWDKDKLGVTTDPTENEVIITDTLKNVAMMHVPLNLKSEVIENGAVRLSWNISDVKYPDIVETDQFLIQRSLTGKTDDFIDLGSVELDIETGDYNYKDSTLITNLTADNIDAATGAPKTRYRLMRASTAHLWGYDKNVTVKETAPAFKRIVLQQPASATADWSNREEMKALVKWQYRQSDATRDYVLDERAKMTLEVETTNREGKRVGKTTTQLTSDQIAAKQMEMALPQSCVNYAIRLIVDRGTSPLEQQGETVTAVQLPADKFYYENNGHIIKNSIKTHQLQSSVLLEWDTDNGAIDYFIVRRHDRAKAKDVWESVGPMVTDTRFEDKTTAPHHEYDYCVLAANDCYGITYQSTDTVMDRCKNTGMVDGYVRFADGTGIPGLIVNITSTDGSSVQATAVTDESGYFRRDNLPYWGDDLSGGYNVAPNLNGFDEVRGITFGTQPGQNAVSNVIFYVEQNVQFSGYVLYNGTSIPVPGVSFLVDEREVHNSAGKVTSDFEGKFSFRMLPGPHTIQAVKDGHKFYEDGFYYDGGDTSQKEHNIQTDRAGVYFYDDTRVKLIGRIAGGKDLEALPLDNSLGRNNLGDDLKMVLTLEGDRASRLVWDIQDRQLKERNEAFVHKSHDNDKYQTTVHTTLYRMEVTPDNATGEYEVWLPPVKWKIEQITARGYATLFQDGHTSDVIDLTDSLTMHKDVVTGKWRSKSGKDLTQVTVEYNAIYNRIYHAPVDLEYKQINYDGFDYLGNRYYTYHGVDGTNVQFDLVKPVRKPNWPAGVKDSLMADYTFKYPVFNVERSYPLRISATEKYYYNGSHHPDSVDVVRLSGGRVIVQNDFISSTHRDTLLLDSVGQHIYTLKAQATPYLLVDEQALRTMSITLDLNGTHYEADPLRAYIINIVAQPGAKDIYSVGRPILVDVLRDPPGATSKATLSRGSTLTHSFTLGMDMKRGVKLGLTLGGTYNTWQGVGAGIWSQGENYFHTDLDVIWNNKSDIGFTYSMTTTNDISTSADKYAVGADADVYMGINTNVVLTPALTLGVINDSIYKAREGEVKAGRIRVIASHKDEKTKKTLYLVRTETTALSQQFQSTFVHSQQYIIQQLMPELIAQCKSLMFIGTKAEAQRQANATGKEVYLSLRKPDDDAFGVVNTKVFTELGNPDWEIIYNDTCFEARDGINYVIVKPQGTVNQVQDKVAAFFESLFVWANMIAQNEREKLNATKLYKNFDIDGATGVSYSEEFNSMMTSSETSITMSTSWTYGDKYAKALHSLDFIFNFGINSWKWFNLWGFKREPRVGDPEDAQNQEVRIPGFKWNITIEPVVTCDFTPTYGSQEKYTRKESFTIGMDSYSHLNFDVYYGETVSSITQSPDMRDVWIKDRFESFNDAVLNEIHSELSSIKGVDRKPRSFIYRTRGGATLRTWEDERLTHFYSPGSVLDARTKKIENPVIKMDKQSVSGVPNTEPARFKLLMTNESEQPTVGYPYFNLTLRDGSNPKGARIMMDGLPLTGMPRTVYLEPGEVTVKYIEVYAGDGFDFENLTLRLQSQDDIHTWQEASFDVHYLQSAGNVDISLPGDKWIMNTDAPYDAKRGWYLPVIISGFDKTQPNFDHIEFQYKESTRGDDYWTNLCSFYADSAYYQAASGTKEMIPANGNITTRFFGDGKVMEKGYDLRAVLFCRNGNGYLTNPSKVLSGVKDTRRPTLFGTPEPKDGILDAGEDVVFSFSEPIEYNYLQETTNFEVKGETNENALDESVALQFDGQKSYAESEARRNFGDKSVTVEVMVRPDNTGKAMPIFSHGTDGRQLQLWLTEDRRLRAVVDGVTLEGTTQLRTDAFQRVALVLDRNQTDLRLFTDKLEASTDGVEYNGSGPLIFGATNQADPTKRSHFSGRMLQARVWYRPMDLTLLNSYGNKLLTGYEMGLADYYPMNEGDGQYAADGAQGAHLKLTDTSWSLPRSMSLRLDYDTKQDDGVKGLKLRNDFFSRTQEQDYTLMFWFKTDNGGRGALISNGSGRTTDVDSLNTFFIGFEAETLKYRANGVEQTLGNGFSDNSWHHYAMTMNHTRNVANIYVDFRQKASFSVENIGGMGGDHFYLGNMVWTQKGADNNVLHQENALSGHIDGLTLFAQSLPLTLIEYYGKKGLSGTEKGLVTYLDFCRQERQKDGTLLLVPYVRNKVVKYDADGNVSERNDSVFTLPVDKIESYIDKTDGAPIRPHEELRNLNFSYVGSNHQLMLNINEQDSRINKHNVYVTVSDVPDKNGNIMASPATISFFVDRNPLRWNRRTLSLTDIPYGQASAFTVSVVNNSGANHTFTISNLPKWLKANILSDVIGPREEREITFTVSKDANVGTYDDIIYLTDEDGLSEPLSLSVEVVGDAPQWEADVDRAQFSMTVVAKVRIGDDIILDERDLVGVFDTDGTCLGSAHIDYDTSTSESMAYLTVYDDKSSNASLTFKLWHFQTGKIMLLTPSQTVTFKPNGSAGTTKEPITLTAGDRYIQEINLVRGWNWVSFNVYSNDFRKGEDILGLYTWHEGDMFIDDANDVALRYEKEQWVSNRGGKGIKSLYFTPSRGYRIKSNEAKKMELQGSILRQPGDRTISVKSGWNSIGYTPMLNLPVATALADYFDQAEDGDLVKNRTEFAMFTVSTNGSKEWKGNLRYMKPGEGYMLYRKSAEGATFRYPFYEPGTTFFEDAGTQAREVVAAELCASTMSLTAAIDGVEAEEGDRLLALSGGEIVGVGRVEADAPVYISIAGNTRRALSFAVEHDGDIVATSDEALVFAPNAISGTPDEPTVISFVRETEAETATLPGDGWYTVQGVKLPGAPKRSGIYIHNGRKLYVK